jgi:hypothetical protein
VQFEVLEGKESTYYHTKINGIKQDIRDNEKGISGLYQKKADLIQSWAVCEEALGQEISTIARIIVSELIALDCKRGVKHAYRVLDKKYKRDYKQDLVGLGDEEEENVVNATFETASFLELPNEIISLETAPHKDIQENEEALSKLVKESKRRWQEYIDVMRRRGIARIGQRESDVIGTPRPYDAAYGFFYEELVGLPLENKPGGFKMDLDDLAGTINDMAAKIADYPPETVKEDKELAAGIKPWRYMIQWINEHLRPYADEKFSQSYVDWFATEALNRDFGKHAAAVKSKIATLSGGFRGMTREQVGDKIPDLAEKAINFRGALEIANKGFLLMQKDLPFWRKRRLDPSVGTRKETVGPKLSESAFGSSKDY